jgi:hypothetical protein
MRGGGEDLMRPAPAAGSPLLGRDPRREVDALLAVLGRACGDAAPAPAGSLDPGALLDLARLNKALLHLAAGPAPDALGPSLQATRLRATAMNLATLALSREVERLLAAEGIRPLHLKGPLQQIDLHGSPVTRPSGDVDLLVAARHRGAAAGALRRAGFAEQERGLAPWWRAFLGETHFRRPSGAVVDLHHRLDQPGLPRVRRIESLLDEAREQEWRGASFLVPSQLDGALVAAIGVAKALVGQEPCGGHLVDLRASLDRLDRAEREALDARAAHLNLEPVLALGRRALDSAFGPATGRRWSRPGDRPLETMADEALALVLLAPWAAPPLRRRHLLWSLSGGSPATFLGRMGWWQLSNGVRTGLASLGPHRGAEQATAEATEARP